MDVDLDGLRTYWRLALGLSATGMAVLALLLMNITFYESRPNGLTQGLTLIWGYLLVLRLSVQLYADPSGANGETESVGALRMAVLVGWRIRSSHIALVLIAAILTVLGILTIIFFF